MWRTVMFNYDLIIYEGSVRSYMLFKIIDSMICNDEASEMI